MKRFLKFTFGAFLGAFLGGTLIILFTPESGEVTREAIAARFNSLANQVQDAMHARKEQLTQEYENFKKDSF